MPLPALIEIIPLTQPVRAEITVPGSKSITNRALILAALADGEVTLKGALWSEDTQIMTECLKELGFSVNVAVDPDELCNRTITVVGGAGQIPAGGSEAKPLELFVGNAGTAARFLAPFLCLGSGVYRLSGVPRMHERPQAALFSALRELGYRIESEFKNDKLPVRISHRVTERTEESTQSGSVSSVPLWQKKNCRVSIEESSQFASALLLSAGVGGWQIEIIGENAEESPYVAMTSKLMEVFPKNGGTFQIEPDASSGSYFWALNYLYSANEMKDYLDLKPKRQSPVYVLNWPHKSGWQIDSKFPDQLSILAKHNFLIEETNDAGNNPNWRFEIRNQPILPSAPPFSDISRKDDLGDSIMTMIAVVTTGYAEILFSELGRLRVQECERVVALRTELTKCGARLIEEGDTLTVYPSQLHGAEIETYNDHRMAMCFAVLGLKVPGIKIKNPACVKKTFPNFFQKLAAAPPHGLGAEIRDAKTGRRLTHEELFAD
jgi:3-phosphoshikimate 1-carboxyvinyltransferase